MDGNQLFLETRAAETLRQQRVYENAMASLERKSKKRAAEGRLVMAAFDGFAAVSQGKGFSARLIKLALPAFVILAGAAANYLFWTVAMNG